MYQSHYNLRELPFELTPDPSYLYLTVRHREALSNLEYGLSAAKALTVLIGEAGTGKTTLINTVFSSQRCRHVRCVYVNNPMLTRAEFVSTLATRFDLGADAAQSKSILLDRLEPFLRRRLADGEVMALVVDEAQRLSTELLEEIRLLANIETPTRKLLPLVLAGQPELGARLEEPELRQLKQRVALRCEVSPFDLSETAAYIASRVKAAGGVPFQLFTREAVVLIHERSAGIPRTINVICDNSLMTGMALNRQMVDQAIVLEVCRDFALQHRPLPQEPPPLEGEVAAGTIAPASERAHSQGARPSAGDPPRTGGESNAVSGGANLRGRSRFSVFGSGLS
jgi:general secretion pathway protein A